MPFTPWGPEFAFLPRQLPHFLPQPVSFGLVWTTIFCYPGFLEASTLGSSCQFKESFVPSQHINWGKRETGHDLVPQH